MESLRRFEVEGSSFADQLAASGEGGRDGGYLARRSTEGEITDSHPCRGTAWMQRRRKIYRRLIPRTGTKYQVRHMRIYDLRRL